MGVGFLDCLAFCSHFLCQALALLHYLSSARAYIFNSSQAHNASLDQCSGRKRVLDALCSLAALSGHYREPRIMRGVRWTDFRKLFDLYNNRYSYLHSLRTAQQRAGEKDERCLRRLLSSRKRRRRYSDAGLQHGQQKRTIRE